MSTSISGIETPRTPATGSAGPGDLEQAFRTVQSERMADVALLNPVLSVEAIGFRAWKGDALGVLLTPWFMSLVLLPGADAVWNPGVVGEQRDWTFPSGRYAFMLGWNEWVGWYQSCSLFSPVFEFDSQDGARAVALAALDALLKPTDGKPADASSGTPSMEQRLHQPVSRRQLLRGVLMRGRDESGGG